MNKIKSVIRYISPISLSYIFVGIACGLLYKESGYTIWQTIFASVFIYAGTMQIVLAPLMLNNMPIYMIAVMTFFINGRHIFYAIAMLKRYKYSFFKRMYMAFTLTDEVYSVLVSPKYKEQEDIDKMDFYIHLTCHMLWALSTFVGYFMGKVISFDLKGIEFSATAFFTVVVVEQFISYKSHIPVIVGFSSAILFYFVIGSEKFILPALILSVIVLCIMRMRVQTKLEVIDE